MDNTVEIYETEKELREKRLAAYAEAIQKKVQRDSEQIITGVRASNIARFEGATCTPTLIMLEKYANALGKHIEIRVCEDK